MSSHVPARAIPPQFPEILRDFAREVLRSCPKEQRKDAAAWVYKFGADYFLGGGISKQASMDRIDRVIAAEASTAAEALSYQSGPAVVEDLESSLVNIFRRADTDGSGSLDHKEFRRCVKSLSQHLGLQSSDVRQLMAVADTSEDGLIQYSEFIPIAVTLISMIAAKERVNEATDALRKRAEDMAQYVLVRGMTPEEVQQRLLEAFAAADVDGDGQIGRDELHQALQSNPLGLSRRDINLLMAEADLDGSGQLNFTEFAPLCYALLAESLAKQIQIEMLPWEEASLASHIKKACENFDHTEAGRITKTDFQNALRDADLHLSWLQIQAIAAAAPVGDDGLIDYYGFAPAAGTLVKGLLAAQVNADAAAKILELRATATINGMDKPTFSHAVHSALSTVDQGNGRALIADVRSVLRESVGLDERQTECIVAGARAVSEQSDKTIDLGYIVDYAFDSLLQLLEIDMLRAGPL